MDLGFLIKPYRLGCPTEKRMGNPDRSEFQRDFDRIIFSTAFRRLNGKTQVFPFPETDGIHTRLTHSLETASVGRSLGTIVGNKICGKDSQSLGWELGSIVCAACLAHDIGNPPLGHSGEKAIAEYFKSERGKEIIKDLNPDEKADFTSFEGNAMGFHILTYSSPKKTNAMGGLGLTFPTLAAFVKYPRPVGIYNQKPIASERKMGLFQHDIGVFEEIAEVLQIPKKSEGGRWNRHPLAFLTEAADDICYGIMDLEDGYRHGLVSYDETSELLEEICKVPEGETDIDSLSNIIDDREKIGYLRAKAINSLIYQVTSVIFENKPDIIVGRLDESLCKLTKSNEILEKIRDISFSQIYSYRPVLQVEAAGFRVLPGLLDIFLYALKDSDNDGSKKVLQLIPDEYKLDYHEKPYEAILSITAYVAGMTDAFAVDTYRNLTGIQLPNY